MKADVVIVGGGSAGCMAAIKAKEAKPGIKVLVMEKADIRRSGAIAMGMDALNIGVIPGVATPEEFVRERTKRFDRILDQELFYFMAEKSLSVVKELEEWGVDFPKDEQGQYMVHHHFPPPHSGRFLLSMNAPNLKLLLAKKVEEMGVDVLNHTMATSLLTTNGSVAGVTGLNVRTGEFVTCEAKAVVLATGPAGRFGLPQTGYLYGTYEFPGNAGDGYSMAYRAGAELTGFEYTIVFPLIKDYEGPASHIATLYGAKVFNALGAEVEATPQGMLKELREGRWPLHASLSNLSEDAIKQYEELISATERPSQMRFLKGRNIDLRKDGIEVGPSGCFLCGGHGMSGLVVNRDAETSLEGLYAAGDVASIPGQYLTGALLFGGIAGANAAKYASSHPDKGADREQLESERKRVYFLKDHSGPLTVEEVEYKTRRIIQEYLPSPKNEVKLASALKEISRMRADAERIGVKDYHELGRALELQCILDCAEMSARASLTRKESRWGWFHYRTDYPKKDDENWLKQVIIRRDLKSGNMLLYSKPVKLKWPMA